MRLIGLLLRGIERSEIGFGDIDIAKLIRLSTLFMGRPTQCRSPLSRGICERSSLMPSRGIRAQTWSFTCPAGCGQTNNVSPKRKGDIVTCKNPGCGKKVRVPAK